MMERASEPSRCGSCLPVLQLCEYYQLVNRATPSDAIETILCLYWLSRLRFLAPANTPWIDQRPRCISPFHHLHQRSQTRRKPGRRQGGLHLKRLIHLSRTALKRKSGGRHSDHSKASFLETVIPSDPKITGGMSEYLFLRHENPH